MKVMRNCYCSLWDTQPEALERQGLVHGFCGTCGRCGALGHSSHYPGPVPATGGWCDRCYLIEKHKAGNREQGAWFYDVATATEREISVDSLTTSELNSMLDTLSTPMSRMLIEFKNGIGVDFWVRPDGSLEMSFGDPERGLWGCSIVSTAAGRAAMEGALKGEDLREKLGEFSENVEYFQEPDDHAAPPN